MTKIRPIAIYLPQFYPTTENDEWWCKGFTEWTNVTRAKPLFQGHQQPQLPADLGFYDLRLSESRLAQEQLARKYGIFGFCYYHYWFNGKRMLQEPLDRKLENSNETLPFMLCWANENWTRVWDGSENEILLEQNYSEDDDRKHISHLMKYLKDPRYMRINGKHIIAIYKSELLPNPRATINIWREIAALEGIDLMMCRMEAHGMIGEEFLESGFDKSIDFQPFGYYHKEFVKFISDRQDSLFLKLLNKIKRIFIAEACLDNYLSVRNGVFEYEEYVDYYIKKGPIPNTCFPCVCPGWDNSARKKKNFFILNNTKPSVFAKWVKYIKDNQADDTLLFINAWNEWAEGNHLEPCQRFGTQYLEKLKETLVD